MSLNIIITMLIILYPCYTWKNRSIVALIITDRCPAPGHMSPWRWTYLKGQDKYDMWLEGQLPIEAHVGELRTMVPYRLALAPFVTTQEMGQSTETAKTSRDSFLYPKGREKREKEKRVSF